MRILIRLVDWAGRAFDLRDLLLLLAGDAAMTGGIIAWLWEEFSALPEPAQWLFSISFFCLFLSVGGYALQKFHKPSGPYLFDTDQLTHSVLVYEHEIDRKKFEGDTPFITIKFWIFNGSGFLVKIENEIDGKVALRAPLTEDREMVWSVDFPEQNLEIPYPGNGIIKFRQFLTSASIEEARKWAESPEIRSIHRIFDDDTRPSFFFTFSEVRIAATAQHGRSSQRFWIKLPNYVSVPIPTVAKNV